MAQRARRARRDRAQAAGARGRRPRARGDACRRRLDAKLDDQLREARARDRRGHRRAEGARPPCCRDRRPAPRPPRRSARATPARRAPTRARRSTQVVGRLEDRRRVRRRPTPRARRAARRRSSRASRVAVGALGLEGVVLEVHGKHAEVDVRGKRLRARAARPARDRRAAPTSGEGAASTSTCSRATGSLSELNVIGCTVDEALDAAREVPRRIDASPISRSVRIVHGHGTGQLRRAVAAFPQGASARGAVRGRAAEPGRRRRDDRGAEGLESRRMALFPQQFIDDLKQHADIVVVIQDYVSLKKTGATYKGLCPFHGEKTPSFHVNRDKGFFHCFGCGVGGDVFKFLELHEKVGFHRRGEAARAAVRHGAAGARAERRAAGRAPRSARRCSRCTRRRRRGSASSCASPAGARIRAQIADRGVSAATGEALGLGFAPPGRDGAEAGAARRRASRRRCCCAPACSCSATTERSIDRFRNRLMIPICRDTGSVIAFGGRALDADQQPKYLNSPETPIYSKSRTLYGLNLTQGGHPAERVRRAGRGLLRLRAGLSGRVPGRRGLVRHGADAAAGAAAAPVHGQGRAELRPGRGRPGRGGEIVRNAGGRRV